MTAARRLCASEGVGVTSIRGVIRASGANLNAVHYHFGSRENLIETLVDQALGALNEERFDRFSKLGTPCSARDVLRAGYGPVFRQALGPEREQYREGLLIVGQLRFDPSGAGASALERHASEFIQEIESRLHEAVPISQAQLRFRMRLVNAAAWDSALRPDVMAEILGASHTARAVTRFTNRFLDFAVAGLGTQYDGDENT